MTYKTKNFIWIVLAVIGVWYFFQPHSYEDCVMNGMSNAKTESAMYALRSACRKKFPSDYTVTPKQPKDLLHTTPPPVDFKTPPKVMTSFMGINIGDSISDLIYKFGDKTLTKERFDKVILSQLGNFWVDIELDRRDKVAYIYMSCWGTTEQLGLNGVYCGSDESAILKKFGKTNVEINCLEKTPTTRVANIKKYNTSYYLEASKVIGLAISNQSLGIRCN